MSEPLGLPVESAAWQLAGRYSHSRQRSVRGLGSKGEGRGRRGVSSRARGAGGGGGRCPAEPRGSLPSPAGNPDSDLGRAIDAAIREADEALAAIGADLAAEDGRRAARELLRPTTPPRPREPLPESSESDDNASDAATAEPTAEPKAEPTTPTAEPKAESKAASGAKAAGSKYDDAKYDGAKYDGAKADSKEAPETDNEAVAAGDPAYGALIKLLDAAQRGDHAVVATILREADPAARRRLAGLEARVGSSFTSSTPLELAAAAHEEGEEAAVECCALLLIHTCASKDALAAARRVGNDAVVALLETAPPPQDEPQDETPEPQDETAASSEGTH